jgi:hypothetical protein
MGTERARGGSHYYRSVRDGERVRKKYVGTGELAEALAHSDETIRLIRKLEREKEREELERLKALAAPVLELDEVAKVLARAHLVAGGFRKRRGEWRRERTT